MRPVFVAASFSPTSTSEVSEPGKVHGYLTFYIAKITSMAANAQAEPCPVVWRWPIFDSKFRQRYDRLHIANELIEP